MKEPLKNIIVVHSAQIDALSTSTSESQRRRKRHEREKMNFGWNLFTATSNIKLVSCFLVFAFFLSSLPLPPKTPIHIKTVTKRRITELPNCFYTIVSLTHSLSLLLHRCRGRRLVLLQQLLCCVRTYIYIRPRKKKKCMK